MPYEKKIINQLEDFNFELLHDNWDGDGAKAPGIEVIQRAMLFLQIIQQNGQEVFNIAPGPLGEIMIDSRRNGKSVEILVYPDKNKYVFFPLHERPEQGEFQQDELPAILQCLNE